MTREIIRYRPANHRNPLVFSIIRDAVICVGIVLTLVAMI